MEIFSYCLLCQHCSRLRFSKKEYDHEDEEDPESTAIVSATPATTATLTHCDQWILWVLTLNDWNECITVKFILEVCGACGAAWGFSEVVGLHTEYTKESVWRPVACTIGVIFGLRWLRQTIRFAFLDHSPVVNLVTEPMTLQKETSVQLADRRLHVSASVRRLSQNVMGASMRALGATLQQQDFSYDNSAGSISQESHVDDDKEEASNPTLDDDIEDGSVALGSDLRFLVSDGDGHKETYNSCDE
jgi:hypothetical protein